MDRHELKKAAAAVSALETAERNLAALAGHGVTAITVDRGDGGLSPITLAKGNGGGTGTINSIHYSDRFRAAMTNAMRAYLLSEVESARGEVAKYGIDVAA